ncbi:RING finger domain-containing protein [Endozoicomonas ascidiicola]|uniref:RING finger domain-containing protein n=1 Tax=Endozoicomonas ascidiicola TaxID=1698521 RepID=UPI000836D1EE|nr:RING finger domain-containing protein [Endozoicomonas ascidiicola]
MNTTSTQIKHPVVFQPDTSPKNSVPPADTANFKGHQLQATQSTRRVEAALQGECSICMDTFTDTEVKPLSLLPCFHLFHSACVTEALRQQQSCPECRAPANHSTIKAYENSTLLRESLPQECTENLCTVVGAKTSISSGTKTLCPYPLATFSHQEADNFLEKNNAQIIDWLRESFAQKQYTTAHVLYDEKFCGSDFEHLHHKPAITLTVQFNPSKPMRELYYSSVDINKAETPEAAFTNLLEDIRTDLLFLSLRNTHPAIFNSSTELCIYHYDLWTHNAIYINDKNNSVPLRSIFNPSTKSFSWDSFKQELGKIDFEYKKLFETTPSREPFMCQPFSRMGVSQSRGVDVLDGFHSISRSGTVFADSVTPNSQHPVSESRLEIPSGELETDNFLF